MFNGYFTLNQFNRRMKFLQGVVIIDQVPRVLGNVAHDHVSTLPVYPSAVQQWTNFLLRL